MERGFILNDEVIVVQAFPCQIFAENYVTINPKDFKSNCRVIFVLVVVEEAWNIKLSVHTLDTLILLIKLKP